MGWFNRNQCHWLGGHFIWCVRCITSHSRWGKKENQYGIIDKWFLYGRVWNKTWGQYEARVHGMYSYEYIVDITKDNRSVLCYNWHWRRICNHSILIIYHLILTNVELKYSNYRNTGCPKKKDTVTLSHNFRFNYLNSKF